MGLVDATPKRLSESLIGWKERRNMARFFVTLVFNLVVKELGYIKKSTASKDASELSL